jgi:hypothetical protein
MSKELSEIMQDAALMVSQTAAPHEDTVKTLGDLSQKLHQAFEQGGAESASAHLDVISKAREEGAKARVAIPANPHLS